MLWLIIIESLLTWKNWIFDNLLLKLGTSRYSKTSGINSAKYSRGSSQTMSPARSTGLTAAGVPGGSTGRNRVYSILDKIRIANEERYSQHHAQPNHENVVSNLKPFNGGR